MRTALSWGVHMTALRPMSDMEISRFEVLQRVIYRRMTQQQARQVLGLNCRQIYRLLQAIKQYGAAGVDLEAPGQA